MLIDRSENESEVSKKIRMHHHAHHNLEPMEECDDRGCMIHTGRFPKRSSS